MNKLIIDKKKKKKFSISFLSENYLKFSKKKRTKSSILLFTKK